MSEELESTQPSQPADPSTTLPLPDLKEDDTQPIRAKKKEETPEETAETAVVAKKSPAKPARWKSILIGVLGFVILVGFGTYSGIQAGIGVREDTALASQTQQLAEQFALADLDIQAGRYENARQRLEFIIGVDPNFPGAKDKLTEVLVLSTIPTPTIAPTITATPDFSGVESAYARAQELIRAQDWTGALTALDTLRKMDANYKTAQIDGMYYFALRNKGYDLIIKEGNLEGGIYYLTLAERFGPLDNNARGIRDGARAYMTGASFWELDWEQAASYFEQVAAGWPSLWDGTMTAAQRYYTASVRFADELYTAQDFCAAYDQYQKATAMGQLDGTAAANSANAFNQCYPPTPEIIVENTPEITPTP
ncbi:MAG TPA: hypothetical protein PK078_11350 [Anaerolineales bacterium]|nr:hypothetical protein [Anaerolineales bacterium]HNB35517.1 hypothetical protein [Anaerolineales bacterium]HNC07718.1 hypothetical protein [Anaerolineales bacterium]